MDWTHVAAFVFGFVVFVIAIMYSPKSKAMKKETITKRDLFACHIFPALWQAAQGGTNITRNDTAAEAIRCADALVLAGEEIEQGK